MIDSLALEASLPQMPEQPEVNVPMLILSRVLAGLAFALTFGIASTPVYSETKCRPVKPESSEIVCSSDVQNRGYDGKDGPAQRSDVYWFGQSGSGNMCWFERNATGHVLQRRCGKVPLRLCGQSAEVCDPRDDRLCVPNQPLGASPNFYNLTCEKFDAANFHYVDMSKAISSTAYENGNTLVIGEFRCTFGHTCDASLVEGKLVDVILRLDSGLAKGAPLRIGNFACQHLVDCQRMLTGDVYPIGVSSLNHVMEASDRAKNPEKYAQPAIWHKMPGIARDIGAGADGSVWVIGAKQIGEGGNEIYRWAGDQWVLVGGGAQRISVDGAGKPWVATKNNEIYRWNGRGWDGLPGAFVDIAVNASGQAWGLSTKKRPGGNEVYRWSGTGWTLIGGGMNRLAVDSNGDAWGVSDRGLIYRWVGRDWQQLPGAAVDIGIGGGDSVFIAGTDGNVHKWNGSGWTKRDGKAFTAISVDGRGVPYAVTPSGEIYRGVP